MKLRSISRNLVDRILKSRGMELKTCEIIQHDWLKGLGIRTVLDIGANKGQFAAKIRGILPNSSVYSFEPLHDVHANLLFKMGTDPAFKAFNFALGDLDARALIHRSGCTLASSLLPMIELQRAAWQHTAEVRVEEIHVRQLDKLDLLLEPNVLVKIDVHGVEDKVIAGGAR